MSKIPEMKPAKLREVEERYTQQGYEVVRRPGPGDVPFLLSGYRPDLLARKDDQHILIDVRTPGQELPVDLMTEVALTARKLPGWRYLLFTVDDLTDDAPGFIEPLPAWPELRRRCDDAIRLAQSGSAPEAGALALWSALEGMLRKTAEDAGISTEREPLDCLLTILYSEGELSLRHYDSLRGVLGIRRRLIHGYNVDPQEIAVTSRYLIDLMQELPRPRVEQAA